MEMSEKILKINKKLEALGLIFTEQVCTLLVNKNKNYICTKFILLF